MSFVRPNSPCLDPIVKGSATFEGIEAPILSDSPALFLNYLKILPHSDQESKNPFLRIYAERGFSLATELRGGGQDRRRGTCDYAVLRRGASAAWRFAMNAARRLPRVQGITVSFLAAVFVIDLMKRALVFMSLVLNVVLLLGAALA
jgi:hypothetical protein